MENKVGTLKAISALNGTQYKGRKIEVGYSLDQRLYQQQKDKKIEGQDEPKIYEISEEKKEVKITKHEAKQTKKEAKQTKKEPKIKIDEQTLMKENTVFF